MAIDKFPYIRAYKKEQAKGDKYGIKKILVGLEGLKAKGKLDLDITGLESNSKT